MTYPGTNTLAAVAAFSAVTSLRSCGCLLCCNQKLQVPDLNFLVGDSGGCLFGGGGGSCCGCMLCFEQMLQAPDLLFWAGGDGGSLFGYGVDDSLCGDGPLVSGGDGGGSSAAVVMAWVCSSSSASLCSSSSVS